MNDPPEPIASAGKVAAGRCRKDARIDSAKYHRQTWFKDVRKTLKWIGASHGRCNPLWGRGSHESSSLGYTVTADKPQEGRFEVKRAPILVRGGLYHWQWEPTQS